MPTQKTVLIIATTFFPDPVVGAVRLTQWCRHLPELGWKPHVLCRHYGYTATPDELAEHVHQHVEVRYFNPPSAGIDSHEHTSGLQRGQAWASVRNSAVVQRVTRDTAGRLMVPDVSIRFWRGARSRALRAVDELRPAVVLTSSPPHSVHDVGKWLRHERPQLRWVADFRDPYLIDPRYGARGLAWLRGEAHQAYERAIYETADLVTHAIPIQARWARRQYVGAQQKIRILTNGFPDSLLTNASATAARDRSRRTICVMGATDPAQRSQLVRVVRNLIDVGEDVDVCFVGPEGADDTELATALADRFTATGLVPHHIAMGHLRTADVLVGVLPEYRSRFMGISSKLFEFLACGKPVVVINPTRPDRQLARGLHGIRLTTTPSDASLKADLQWALSPQACPPPAQTESVQRRFSRRTQAATLAGWLDELV